ncbi:MAG: hypothetical protein J5501_10535 [Ruminococcus sp.]|nr:hypothetical protein [Ruminococcus sp.]
MKSKRQLLCFVIAAVCAASVSCGKKNVRTSDESDIALDSTSSVSEESTSSADDEGTENDSKDTKNSNKNSDASDDGLNENEKPTKKAEVRAPDGGEPIVISINTPEGEFAEEYSTAQDIDLNRPASLGDNEVFTGWKEQKTLNSIENGEPVSGDVILLTPETSDIGGKKNTIYNNAVFTHTGSANEFSVPVRIGGDAEFCVLDLEIKYDPSVLEFVRFENTDSDAAINYKAEENKILLSFVTRNNIKSDTLLSDIVFKPVTDEYATSQLYYSVSDIALFNSNSDKLEDTEYNITACDIVMY